MGGLMVGGMYGMGTAGPYGRGRTGLGVNQPGFRTPTPNGATTEAQNQWLNPGNMPIDEGKVAYERQLEAAKKTWELQQEGAKNQQSLDFGTMDKKYALGEAGANANQGRLFQTMEYLGLPSLLSQTSQGGGSAARVTGGDADFTAAQAAAMGKAKDASAAAVGAARKAMLDNMTRRGISGSGIEAAQDMAIQLAGAGQIGAAGRDIATNTANRAATVADRNYQGDITQRGQDLQAQQARLSLIPSLMSLFRVSASY